MHAPLDKFLSSPLLWLGAYGLGSVMTLASVHQVWGGQVTGYVSGLLVLAGTVGYESLSRRITEESMTEKLRQLEQQQSEIADTLDKTKITVTTMKDHVAKLLKATGFVTENTTILVPRPMQKKPTTARSFLPMARPANALSVQDIKAERFKTILRTRPMAEAENVSENNNLMAEEPDYSDAIIVELLHQAVRQNKIEIFAQPIVKLPSRNMQFLELFARIRAKSGVYLPAEKYRALALQETILNDLDYLILQHATDTIRSDAQRGHSMGYFINIGINSLADMHFMNELIDFVRAHRDLARRLVLEFQYTDFKNRTPSEQKVLDGLTRLGCFVSVDNVSDLQVNADNLAECGVSFIKFDAAKLLDLYNSPNGDLNISRMTSSLDRGGIQLIVEKIENNVCLKELLDFNIDYGEGFLFGKPDIAMAYQRKRRTVAA